MIKLYDVQKIYSTLSGGQHVLKDINLYFEKGEFVSILGRSGCGKTTLLNLIACLDSPSSGQISIDDKLISKMTEGELDEFRNHRIGIIFQNYNLINHLNVLENVMVTLDIAGSVEEKKERALEMLKRVGLEQHTHKLVTQLSGGQKQRVAIARALVGNPDLILADEPTGALDSKTSKEIMDLIKELCADKLVILVTHNKKIAEEYSTRIIEMKDGRIISDTNPADNRVKVDLDRKLTQNRLGFISAIKYAFKSTFKNKGKTFLLAIGLALGITIIALIDGIFNGARNKISDSFLLKNNQILYSSIYDYENITASPEKVKEVEGVSDAYYSLSNIDVVALDDDKVSTVFLSNILAMPTDVALKNEITENVLYGRMPENDNEIVISYSDLYYLANTNLDEKEMADYVIGKELTIDASTYNGAVMLTDEAIAYYNNLADSYSADNTNDVCIKFDYGNYINHGSFKTTTGIEISTYFSDVEEYKKIERYILNNGLLVDEANNVAYFTNDYSNSFGEEEQTLLKYKICGVFKSELGSISICNGIKNIDFSNYDIKVMFIIIESDSVEDKVSIVKKLAGEDYNLNVYDFQFRTVTNSTSEFALNFLQVVFTAISSVTLITAAVMLWLLIHVSITQRKREIGLLRSMGATKSDVKNVFVGEAVVIGILACLISLVLVLAVTLFANWFIPNHAYIWFTKNFSMLNGNKPFIINVKKLLIIFGIGIAISFIAGLIPSAKAGRKKPIESLRGE